MKTVNIIQKLLTFIPLLVIVFSIYSCNYYDTETISSDTDNRSKVVLSSPEIDNILAEMDRKYENKLYSSLRSGKESEVSSGDTKDDDEFQYGLDIAGFKSYTDYSTLSSMEVSKFSIRKWQEVSFVGFSKDSKYLLYQIANTYYVKELYANKDKKNHNPKKDVVYKTTEKQEAVEFMGSIIETYNYNLDSNQDITNNYFNLRVAEFPDEEKNGFYISIYDVKDLSSEMMICSKVLSKKIDPLGKVSNYDLYFTPDKSWAIVHPYFEKETYNYGFFLINIRKALSKMVKNQAIRFYSAKDYNKALNKYRQCIQLYPSTAEVFYDCAVLTKKLGLPDYSRFAKKAVKLNPGKYSNRAYKEGLIPR